MNALQVPPQQHIRQPLTIELIDLHSLSWSACHPAFRVHDHLMFIASGIIWVVCFVSERSDAPRPSSIEQGQPLSLLLVVILLALVVISILVMARPNEVAKVGC